MICAVARVYVYRAMVKYMIAIGTRAERKNLIVLWRKNMCTRLENQTLHCIDAQPKLKRNTHTEKI